MSGPVHSEHANNQHFFGPDSSRSQVAPNLQQHSSAAAQQQQHQMTPESLKPASSSSSSTKP